MSSSWTEILATRIYNTMRPIPTIPEFLNNVEKCNNSTIPEFLNTVEKWNNIVQQTDTVEKFENILHKLLEDDIVSIVDVFKIMTKLETDTVCYHVNEDIKTVLDVVTSIAKYIYVASKEVLKEAQLIQEAEEINGNHLTTSIEVVLKFLWSETYSECFHWTFKIFENHLNMTI